MGDAVRDAVRVEQGPDADVGDLLRAYRDCCDVLRAQLDVAERVRARATDARVLGPADDGWDGLREPFCDATSFARRYFRDGEVPRRFQASALAALTSQRDVLVAVPCGLGKSAPAALFAAARALEARQRGGIAFAVWVCPTQLLCEDMVRNLNGRYASSWAGRGGKFAVYVAARGEKRKSCDVVFLGPGDEDATAAPRARHHVLQAVEDSVVDLGIMVLTPEMLGTVATWLVHATSRGWVSCFVIDEADDEAGVAGSYRESQARQGVVIRSIATKGAPKAPPPVYAMSGTVAKHDVGVLLEALRIPAPDASAPGTLVVRTAGLRPGVAMEKRDAGRGSWKEAARRVERIVADAPQLEAALVFAFTRVAVDRAGVGLRAALPRERVVTIHGGDGTDAKRERLRDWTASASEPSRARVMVLNEAGHRGINHPNLGTIVVAQPPSSVPALLQLVGRAARGAGQVGRVVFAFRRGEYFQVAATLRDDRRKLAAFCEVVRLCETVADCWRSVAATILGDEPAPAAAVARSGCCPACDAKLAAAGASAPHVERRAVPEIAQLCDAVRAAAERRKDQATFRALTAGALASWGSAYSAGARERVVLSLLAAEVFVLEPAKEPAQCVRFVVNEGAYAERRRTDAWSDIVFSSSEL